MISTVYVCIDKTVLLRDMLHVSGVNSNTVRSTLCLKGE